MIILPHIKLIIDRLHKNGFEAFLVGGCVRDWLLRKNPKDFDIATNALPSSVGRTFYDFHVLDTGILHGTVSIVIDNNIVEVTTYRIDGEYLDSRRPMNVEFTDSIKRDLARRDFTINAMAYSPKLGLVDPFNGKEDLKQKILRCVGDPYLRFKEDALRILRALRFVSELGFRVDEESKNAMNELKSNITLISPERVQSEFSKCLLGDDVELALTNYEEIIKQILPEYKASEYTINTVKFTPAILHIRLSALMHDLGEKISDKAKSSAEIAKRFCEEFRFDNQTSAKVYELILYKDIKLDPDKKTIKHILRKHSEQFLDDLIIFKKANAKVKGIDEQKYISNLEEIINIKNEIIENNECYNLRNLQISGNDLIQMGYSPGRKLGKILNDCLVKVIDEKIPNNCELLKDYVKIKYLL